jgi:hypothetical protein
MYVSTLTPKPTQQQSRDRNLYNSIPETRVLIEDGKKEPLRMIRRETNGGNVVEIEFTDGEPTPFRFSE